MRHWLRAGLALACFAGVAEAQAPEGLGRATTGITYYNRPGATLEDHQAALDRCVPAVRAMSDPNMMLFSSGAASNPAYNTMYSPGATAGAAIILMMVDAARVSAAMERAENTHYQNCMIAQGWRVVRLENTAGRRMSRMRQAELADHLAPLIGATEPEGVIERQFSNDLTRAGSVTPVPTGDGRFISLSRLALPSSSEAAERRREARRMPSQRTREEAEAVRAERQRQRAQEEERARADAAGTPVSIEGNALTAAAQPTGSGAAADAAKPSLPEGPSAVTDLSTVPHDAALIVFRQRGVQGGVLFRRIDGDAHEAFIVGTMSAPPPRPAFGRAPEPAPLEDKVIVLPAPPGRWRMESMMVGGLAVSLCMGSPAFEVAAGEVVYAGDFNFGADPFLPDMALAPAQGALAAAPHFAERVRAASYTNGTTGPCGPAQHVYAYEMAARAPEAVEPAAAPAANE